VAEAFGDATIVQGKIHVLGKSVVPSKSAGGFFGVNKEPIPGTGVLRKERNLGGKKVKIRQIPSNRDDCATKNRQQPQKMIAR